MEKYCDAKARRNSSLVRFGQEIYHPNDMIRYFSDLGYSCFVIRGERLLFFELVTEDTLDTNYIFLHKNHHANIIDNNCYTNAF